MYFITTKWTLTLIVIHALTISQVTPNENCVSECGNAENTLNYSFCYVDKAFTKWEYCLAGAKGSNQSNRQSVTQNGVFNFAQSVL